MVCIPPTHRGGGSHWKSTRCAIRHGATCPQNDPREVTGKCAGRFWDQPQHSPPPPPNPGRGGGAWLGIPFRTRRLNLAGWLRRKFCGGGGGDTSPPSHLCTDPLPPPPCERGGCCPLNKAQYSAKPSVATRRKLNQRDTHTKQRKKHPKNTEKKKKQNKQTNKPNTQAKKPRRTQKKTNTCFSKNAQETK